MAGSTDEGLDQFIRAGRDRTLSLVVVNLDQPEQVRRMIDGVFADHPIDVSTLSSEGDGRDRLLLVEDGEIVAETPLRRFLNAYLLVNSDTYRTSRDQLNSLQLPDVLTELDETVFTVRGYPIADKEKLLLILLSRHVEQLAWEATGGTLRSGFQYLSRLDDEKGTCDVYRTLAGTDVETHVYGIPDSPGTVPSGVVSHTGRSAAYRDSWFVVFDPAHAESASGDREAGDAGQPGPAALVATRTDGQTWRGVWTYDPDRVAAINAYLRSEL